MSDLLKKVIDSLPESVVVIDINSFAIDFSNKCFNNFFPHLLGSKEKSIFANLFPEEYYSQLNNIFLSEASNGNEVQLGTLPIAGDGSTALSWSVRRLDTDKLIFRGTIVTAPALIVATTVIPATETVLVSSSRSPGSALSSLVRDNEDRARFLRRMLHEIKTPLHIIAYTLADLNEVAESLPTSVADQIDQINNQVDGLAGYVSDFSCVVMNEGLLLHHVQSLHIPTLIEDVICCVEGLEGSVPRPGRFLVVLGDAPSTVMANINLRRVLFHLVRNAVQYSPADSQVLIMLTYSEARTSTGDRKGRSTPRPFTLSETGTNGLFTFVVENKTIPLPPFKQQAQRRVSFGGPSLRASAVSSELGLTDTSPMGYGLTVCAKILHAMGSILESSSSSGQEADSRRHSFGLRLEIEHVEDVVDNWSAILAMSPTASAKRSTKNQSSLPGDLASPLSTVSALPLHQLGLAPLSDRSLSGRCYSLCITPRGKFGESPRDAATCEVEENGELKAELQAVEDDESSAGGAAFTVVHLPQSPQRAVSASSPAQLSLSRVLVVDDSCICQKIMTKILAKHGFQADVASNGREACEILSRSPGLYDAVLMDLRMPVMDGLSATWHLRNELQFSCQELPIIAITAESGEHMRRQALAAGANSVLSKPAHSADVIAMLNQILPRNKGFRFLQEPLCVSNQVGSDIVMNVVEL